IFGGFNRPEKMSPRLLAAWREILLRADRSRLVVRGKAFAGSGVRDRFFAMLGHDLEPRVDVAPYAPGEMGAYAGYAAMDVALDTFPYHGTTTTCDALAMGVPVVSWQGGTPPARVGRSLLAAVGLADLSVDGRDAYVAKALELAADTERRRELRRTLRDRLRASPLGDPVGLARALEELYRALVEQRRRGETLRFG
ncbi:MAG TPA: hypothetical protein VL400_07630, partial [Polyangiaceae bacterium]|nr:hypothetical protein [Polyangiaceae bacterium]